MEANKSLPVERRSGARRSLSVEALIRHPSGQMRHGRIRDASLGGLFVETQTSRLKANTHVALAFVQAGSGRRVRGLRAVVARRSKTGIGLRIKEFDRRTLPAVLALLEDGDCAPAKD
jgi:hypothetical protein